jgi:glycosyltransferase involved in cell wall biosynthesis
MASAESPENGDAIQENLSRCCVGWDFTRRGICLSSLPPNRVQGLRFHFVTSSFAGTTGPNVVVHSDLAPNSDELVDLYNDADVFVLPTRADTYSMVALEAMAMGLPVVISDVGGIADIVVEGETGYLLPVDDRSRLRERLRALRADRPLRLSMGSKGRARVEQRFNLEHHVSTVLELLFAAAHSRTGKQA